MLAWQAKKKHAKKHTRKMGVMKFAASFAKTAKKKADAPAKGESAEKKAKTAWVGGPLVGRSAKIFCEMCPAAFNKNAMITEQNGEILLLEVEGIFHSVQVEESQIQLQPPVNPPVDPPRLQLNNPEKLELHRRWPLLDSLQMNERLSGEHIMLGDWILARDLWGEIVGTTLIAPHVIVGLYEALTNELTDEADMEEQKIYKKKAEAIIARRWKVSGLLGFPIFGRNGGSGSEHWTLMVWRRSFDADNVRYYDSGTKMAADNLKVAEMLCALFGMPAPLVRSNKRARQTNGIDCGVFVLHYWEGEVRTFLGYGWTLDYPQTADNIKKRKDRLSKLVATIRKLNASPDTLPKEKVAKKGAKVPETAPEEVEVVTKEQMTMATLAQLAKKLADAGSVPFYGCSKCRWSRGGCIWYKCNPDKCQAHMKKFPEKYPKGSQILADEELKGITDKELLGGGNGKVSS